MTNELIITILVGFGSAVIGASATLLVPLIQKRLDKVKLSDKEMFEYWRYAFDRPAFRGPFTWQSDQQRFEQSIRDTIQAITTGNSPSQNPDKKGLPKSYLKNREWLVIMDKVVDHLRKVTWALSGRTTMSQDQIGLLADNERDEAIKLLNEILNQLKIPLLEIPTLVKFL